MTASPACQSTKQLVDQQVEPKYDLILIVYRSASTDIRGTICHGHEAQWYTLYLPAGQQPVNSKEPTRYISRQRRVVWTVYRLAVLANSEVRILIHLGNQLLNPGSSAIGSFIGHGTHQ